MLKEFRAFILRGNVVELAVGIVIGAAFKSVVDGFVAGFVNPLAGFLGTGNLASYAFCVSHTGPTCTHSFPYGQFLSSVIAFLLISLVVFFFVVKPVNRVMEIFRADMPAERSMRECPECLTSIPVRARRCSACTAQVTPAR